MAIIRARQCRNLGSIDVLVLDRPPLRVEAVAQECFGGNSHRSDCVRCGHNRVAHVKHVALVLGCIVIKPILWLAHAERIRLQPKGCAAPSLQEERTLPLLGAACGLVGGDRFLLLKLQVEQADFVQGGRPVLGNESLGPMLAPSEKVQSVESLLGGAGHVLPRDGAGAGEANPLDAVEVQGIFFHTDYSSQFLNLDSKNRHLSNKRKMTAFLKYKTQL